MSRRALGRVVGVLLLAFLLGLSAAVTTPDGSHIGYMWPTGLTAGALLLCDRRRVAYVGAVLPALAFATFSLADYPTGVAAGYGIGVALESLTIWLVFTARSPKVETGDLRRFALACLGSAAVGGGVFALTSALADYGIAWEVGVATFCTHLASNAVLLGLFRERIGPREAGYGNTERALAWLVTIAAALIAFGNEPTSPSFAFIVIPPLAWVAFRGLMREALVQLIVVATIASTLSNERRGPFSDPALMTLDPEFQHLPLQAFLLACALITIPFAMTVARQRRSADQVLRERARSERLVESARGIAIIGTDDLGQINSFSPAASSILGYAPEEVYGQSTRMFHTDAELARQAADLGVDPTYVSIVRATAELPPGTARLWQFVRKDGIARTLSTILSPVTDDRGRHVGYVATADDITDRIDAQAALEKALETERRAVGRLIEIDQVKDQFISSVSHELRTPITNIVGYVELLQDGMYGEQSSDQADAMTRIDQNSRRLLTLIDDLLTLSSLEHVDQRRRTADVDLVEVVHRAMDIVGPGLDRRDLELELVVPEHPVLVVGDASELERLVINLATNAVKFTPDGGRIAVRLIEGGRHAGPVIEVEDTGIGIPDADQEQLFERFFRTDDAHTFAVQGSGLGLSIAKAITDIHGGTISASSVHGEGSVFRVALPRPPATPVPQVEVDRS